MNVNDKLKELIKKSDRTRSGVATAMGFPNVQTLDRRLLSESVPKVDFVAALLEELGYKLVIVKKDHVRETKEGRFRANGGAIVIDSDFKYERKENMSRVQELKNSEK